MARQPLLWMHTHLLSIRMEYIPVVLNRWAEIMSRDGPRLNEWCLHSDLVWCGRGGSVRLRKCSVHPMVVTVLAGCSPISPSPTLCGPASFCMPTPSSADPASPGLPTGLGLDGNPGCSTAQEFVMVSLPSATAVGAALETTLPRGHRLPGRGVRSGATRFLASTYVSEV